MFHLEYLKTLFSVDGGWSIWSQWTNCSAECGNGTQTRMRTCTNPTPKFSGSPCQGQNEQSQLCKKKACPGMQYALMEYVVSNTMIKFILLSGRPLLGVQ